MPLRSSVMTPDGAAAAPMLSMRPPRNTMVAFDVILPSRTLTTFALTSARAPRTLAGGRLVCADRRTTGQKRTAIDS